MFGFTYRAPCPACGRLVETSAGDEHLCEVDVRSAVTSFDDELATWLATPRGRFAAWDAERCRLA